MLLSDFSFLSSPDRLTTSYLLPVGVGLLVAIYEEPLRRRNRVNSRLKWVVLLLSISYIFCFGAIRNLQVGRTLTMILTSILFIALLFMSDNFFKSSKHLFRLLSRIGRVSYGCYLFHWGIWTVMTGKEVFYSAKTGFTIIGVIIAFIATISISILSYEYFEKPFLRLRKRYQVVTSP